MTRSVAGLLIAAAVGCGPKGDGGGGGGAARPGAKPVPGMELVVFAEDPTGMTDPRYAIVHDRRELELAAGESELVMGGVSRQLQEESLTLRSLTDPAGVRALAQRFDYSGAMANAYGSVVGLPARVLTTAGSFEGLVVAYDQFSITLDTGAEGDARFRVIPAGEELVAVELPERAESTRIAPELVWKVRARKGGKHLVEVSYETYGLAWQPYVDVTVPAGEGEGTGEITAWAALANTTGTRFEDARVRLVEVGQAGAMGGAGYGSGYGGYEGDYYYEEPYVEDPQANVAYRVHTAPSPVTLPAQGQVVMIPFASFSGTVTREHRWEPIPKNNISLRDEDALYPEYAQYTPSAELNEELVVPAVGIDLPRATVRVVRAGEERVPIAVVVVEAVQKGKELRVPLGQSSNLMAERRRKSHFRDMRGRRMRDKFEITIRNTGDAAQAVAVLEHMVRTKDWEIRSESTSHEAAGERSVLYRTSVPARGSSRISYEVEYRW